MYAIEVPRSRGYYSEARGVQHAGAGWSRLIEGAHSGERGAQHQQVLELGEAQLLELEEDGLPRQVQPEDAKGTALRVSLRLPSQRRCPRIGDQYEAPKVRTQTHGMQSPRHCGALHQRFELMS